MEKKYEYLDLLDRKLDESQRKVCCSDINTIVAAGAGSGKTQTLATRFAWLIMENENIGASQILTLTFTKKAAAEMYARIYSNLGKFANNEKTPQPQRDRAKKALDDFANVHIQTLDSYCGGVLRQSANRYGIRPDFTTGSADSISGIKTKALSFVLAHRDNPAVLAFSKPGELQTFAEDFFASIIANYTSLATPENIFSTFIEIQKEKVCQAFNYLMGFNNSGCTDPEVLKCTPYPAIIAALKKEYDEYVAEKPGKNKIEKLEDAYKIYCDFEDLWNGRKLSSKDFDGSAGELQEKLEKLINAFDTFASFILKGSDTLKTLIKQARGKAGDPVELNSTARFLRSLINYVFNFKYFEGLFALLDEFLLEINWEKRSSGALTFKDVSEMALRTLVEQDDIRRQECAAYKKIMIDEFQDNNGANRDLLFLLSIDPEKEVPFPKNSLDSDALRKSLLPMLEQNKLFFVGDEKQSIYKFRGADVAVFNQLKNDLVSLNGQDAFLHMTNNYRSTAELLSSFNHIFGGHRAHNGVLVPVPDVPHPKDDNCALPGSVFMKDVPLDQLYEAGYSSDSCATKPDVANKVVFPPVTITQDNCCAHMAFFLKTNELENEMSLNHLMDSDETQSYFIASKIKEMHSKDPDGSYSDFAILEKSRSKRDVLTRWLDYFEIPYSLDQQAKIFSDGPVNDFYNFLRLCVYPSDVTAFASYLRSPFAGLSQVSMETILSHEKFFDDKNDEILRADLSNEEFEKYLDARKLFMEEKEKSLGRPLTQTLDVLWYDSGYRFETLLNSQVEAFGEHYDLLYEIARECDQAGKSVGWFIDQLGQIKAAEINTWNADGAELDVKEVSYPLEKQDGVQIMTIHKSKGLEFNHVFIWGISGAPKSDKTENYFFDDENGVSVKLPDGDDNFFFIRQKDLADKKALAESRRVIYVACTRAVKDFYIVGSLETAGETDKRKGISISSQSDKTLIANLLTQYYPNFYLDGQKALSAYEDIALPFNPQAPFDFMLIGAKPKNLLWKARNESSAQLSSTDKKREELCAQREETYKNAKIIQTPKLAVKRLSPSALEMVQAPECGLHFSDVPLAEYGRINEIIEQKSNVVKQSDIPEQRQYKFSYADFGTLAHFVMECYANGKSFEDENLKAYALSLSERDRILLFELCRKMKVGFANSKLGSELFACKKRGGIVRPEWTYRTSIDGWIFTGSLDLLFQNEDGTFTIVDYKTDMNLKPELYFYQQTCYRRAAADLLGVSPDQIRCYLYYLRFHKAVDITEYANQKVDSALFEKLL
ncbi:MAG: UvrD-helicase domain-containing protein [Treponema sp.]|nr:UvrD-helicase domain-containing protein [Treponema sp.]